MALHEEQDARRVFAHEYVIDFNASRAYIAAGYSPKTAYTHGPALRREPEVRAMIDDLLRERFDCLRDLGVKIVESLAQIALKTPDAQWSSSAIIRAHELVMRHLGLFKDEIKVVGTVRLEDLVPRRKLPQPEAVKGNGHNP